MCKKKKKDLSIIIDILSQISSLWGIVLCIVGCLAASLVSYP